jgi:hypothetical protein
MLAAACKFPRLLHRLISETYWSIGKWPFPELMCVKAPESSI